MKAALRLYTVNAYDKITVIETDGLHLINLP